MSTRAVLTFPHRPWREDFVYDAGDVPHRSPLDTLAIVPLGSLAEDWTLLEGSGQRIFRHTVVFDRPFSAPPVVHLGVVGVDASKHDNLRLRVRADDIETGSFAIVVETWLHTQLWAVDVSWLAIGG